MRRKLARVIGSLTMQVVFLAGLAPAARGAEIVTLRNGYQMRCDHHAEADGQVWLYLGADEDNYIELRSAEITGVAPAPDQPALQPVPGAAANRSHGADHLVDGRLNHADLSEMLAQAGRAHNLDVDLLASLVNAESAGDPRAVSRAGAEGLMQLMPSTAATLGVRDRFQPDQNVRGGSRYLDALLTRYHDNLALALAAYNAGPEAVDRYHGVPPYPETRVYVARVIHEFNRRVREREAAVRRAAASTADAGSKPLH